MEVTCDRRETGSPTCYYNPTLENNRYEIYTIHRSRIQISCTIPSFLINHKSSAGNSSIRRTSHPLRADFFEQPPIHCKQIIQPRNLPTPCPKNNHPTSLCSVPCGLSPSIAEAVIHVFNKLKKNSATPLFPTSSHYPLPKPLIHI